MAVTSTIHTDTNTLRYATLHYTTQPQSLRTTRFFLPCGQTTIESRRASVPAHQERDTTGAGEDEQSAHPYRNRARRWRFRFRAEKGED